MLPRPISIVSAGRWCSGKGLTSVWLPTSPELYMWSPTWLWRTSVATGPSALSLVNEGQDEIAYFKHGLLAQTHQRLLIAFIGGKNLDLTFDYRRRLYRPIIDALTLGAIVSIDGTKLHQVSHHYNYSKVINSVEHLTERLLIAWKEGVVMVKRETTDFVESGSGWLELYCLRYN